MGARVRDTRPVLCSCHASGEQCHWPVQCHRRQQPNRAEPCFWTSRSLCGEDLPNRAEPCFGGMPRSAERPRSRRAAIGGQATRATAVSIDGKRRREARDSWQGAELVCEMRTRRWLRCLMAVGGSGGGARGRPDDAAVHRRRAPVVSPVRGLKPRFALPPARLGLVRSPWPPPVGGFPSARTAARWVMRRAARGRSPSRAESHI